MSEHMLDIRLMNDCAYVTRPGSTLQKPIAIKDLVDRKSTRLNSSH